MLCMLSEILAGRAQSDVISSTSSGVFISPFCTKMFLVRGLEEIAWKFPLFCWRLWEDFHGFSHCSGFCHPVFEGGGGQTRALISAISGIFPHFSPTFFSQSLDSLSCFMLYINYSFFFRLLGSLLAFVFFLLISNFYSVEICVLPLLSLSAAGILCDLDFP